MCVGFIVECGPEGAETKVIPFLARQIFPSVQPKVVTLDVKTKVRSDCGRWARELLRQGCGRVLIIWDLLPSWGQYEGAGCLKADRTAIHDSLRNAGLNPADGRVRLVCIHHMLESWIIADERAVSRFLSTDAHRVRVDRQGSPESIKDPKAALITLFRKSKSRHQRYVDHQHAFPIIRHLDQLGLVRLNGLPSFERFRTKLTANDLTSHSR